MKSSFVLPLTPSTSDPSVNESRLVANEYGNVDAQLPFLWNGKYGNCAMKNVYQSFRYIFVRNN